jgi:cytochrome c oxidase subunit II
MTRSSRRPGSAGRHARRYEARLQARADKRRGAGRPGGQSGQGSPARYAALAGIVVAVAGAAWFLGFADLFGQRGAASTAEAVTVRMSMAGFDPPVITGTAGAELTLEMWTTDSALHLEGGVHTMISDELGIYEELQANSRRTVTLRMPTVAGDYDIFCDTCCGGRLSPSMHGILRVQEG